MRVRLGDTAFGTCFWPPPVGPQPAVGIIISGNPQELSGGLPVAGVSDMVAFPCGIGLIMAGAPTDMNLFPQSSVGAPISGPMVQAVTTSGNPQDLSI